MLLDSAPGTMLLGQLRGKLVVSCQAHGDNPLRCPLFMAAMAAAAVQAGAAGIRADGPDDIAAIRQRVSVPIIGIFKVEDERGRICITPTAAAAEAVIAAGAHLVALDGTPRPRPGGEDLASVIAAIHDASGIALADIGTMADAKYALDAGADLVGTTLSGYIPDSPRQEAPDFALLCRLVATSPVPVFAEGRIATPEQAAEALALGAAFVVVGTAITNPMAITARFVAAMSASRQ